MFVIEMLICTFTILPCQIWPKACCCGVPEDAVQSFNWQWKWSWLEAQGWLLLRAGTSGPSSMAGRAAEGSARALLQVRRSTTLTQLPELRLTGPVAFLTGSMLGSCTTWGYLWSNMDSWPCSPTAHDWRQDNSSTPSFCCSNAFTLTGLFMFLTQALECTHDVSKRHVGFIWL